MSTVNATHRKRLARTYAERTGVAYMAALDAVNKAATAGLLPARLDEAGMQAALRILTDTPTGNPAEQVVRPSLSTHVTVQQTLEALGDRKRADDPRDQQIFDLSAVYEAWTGKQGLMYISSPGGGKDKYVFGSGSGGGHVCLGREEALTHITGLVNNATPPTAQASAPPHLDDADRLHLEKPYLALLRQVWQGRVSLEVVHTTPKSATTHFAVDNTKVGDKQEIELHWLLSNDYVTHSPLVVGEEWALVHTTEFGDEVLAFHGADTDKFTDGLPAQRRTSPRTFTIKRSDIARCPIKSLSAEHYRTDGSCQCLPDPAVVSAPAEAASASVPAPTFTVRTKSEALALERTGAWQAAAFSDDGDPITMHVPRTLPRQPATWRDLDPATDRLMGGPTTTKVYDDHDRRVNATCDVCNRRLANGEPWWMVYSPDRNWENNAGVACISHRPDRLPLHTVAEQTSADRAHADRVARAAAANVHAARPDDRGTHCAVCLQRVKRVQGGQGPTWIHAESGAVAAAGGDPQHPLNQSAAQS